MTKASDVSWHRRGGAIAGQIGRSLLAIVAGYLLLILISTFIQETLLGGVSYRDSSRTIVVTAGILTPLAGVVAGFATALIAGRWPFAHALPMSLAIVTETTVLFRSGLVDGPLWFEALAGGTLIAGVLAGAWRYRQLRLRSDRR